MQCRFSTWWRKLWSQGSTSLQELRFGWSLALVMWVSTTYLLRFALLTQQLEMRKFKLGYYLLCCSFHTICWCNFSFLWWSPRLLWRIRLRSNFLLCKISWFSQREAILQSMEEDELMFFFFLIHFAAPKYYMACCEETKEIQSLMDD